MLLKRTSGSKGIGGGNKAVALKPAAVILDDESHAKSMKEVIGSRAVSITAMENGGVMTTEKGIKIKLDQLNQKKLLVIPMKNSLPSEERMNPSKGTDNADVDAPKNFDPMAYGLQVPKSKQQVSGGPEFGMEDSELEKSPILESVLMKAQKTAKILGEDTTLLDYDDVPIEDFGAALLRGMGWQGEEATITSGASKELPNKPRPARLGLGASIDLPSNPKPKL